MLSKSSLAGGMIKWKGEPNLGSGKKTWELKVKLLSLKHFLHFLHFRYGKEGCAYAPESATKNLATCWRYEVLGQDRG